MTVAWLTIFGAALTTLAATTSLGMVILPERWSRLEARAYGGARRPWWVWVLAGLLLAVWGIGAVDHALHPAAGRTWAGWALVVGVPALWAVKSAALVFNPKGRAVVSSMSDPKAWRQIGLARLPIVPVLAVLTLFA
ncbi:hypothetical protein [Paracoccus seriniphilus]|uniref:DUF3995 domain-containing protein n=1 Tax=Paracoccus seriniphilus TaxID=184748 RepID=A0A239PMW5_9RHOB|nr:hypothetical protein [Paracoccus seriniphilus]WCR15050.1 hypothetical protein JHW44_06470 [Paracoccus seriniphilus]SNT71500.1 hypothetical protein SAMN05444959_1028 [Paracoccus seriniphilus]